MRGSGFAVNNAFWKALGHCPALPEKYLQLQRVALGKGMKSHPLIPEEQKETAVATPITVWSVERTKPFKTGKGRFHHT